MEPRDNSMELFSESKPRYHGLPAVAFIYSLRDLTPFIHGREPVDFW